MEGLSRRSILVILLALAGGDALAADLPRPAVECTSRGGLPNFFAKAKAGSEVRVAYLGGSITAAPGRRAPTSGRFASGRT